jgi:uncharacterized membrane protein
MDDQAPMLLTILTMSLIVYLTRAGGYFLGLKIRHIGRLRPVLEALPGCALMAILVPAVRQGNATEFIALTLVVLLMWKTDNVVIATGAGITFLFFGPMLLT